MSVGDILSAVGRGAADVGRVAGAVLEPLGERTAQVISGEAPQIDEEKRQQAMQLSNQQRELKANDLEQQLEMGRKYGTLTPDQQKQYVDAITGLYSKPEDQGSLLQRLHRAIHPQGTVRQVAQASPALANPVPQGGTEAQDIRNKAMAESLAAPKTLEEQFVRARVASGMSEPDAIKQWTELTTKTPQRPLRPMTVSVPGSDDPQAANYDPSTGQYLDENMHPIAGARPYQKPSNPTEFAEWKKEHPNGTVEDYLKMQAQSRIEETGLGSWAIAEDGNGNPILYNSKTGETRQPTPGLHKSGYFAKEVAPLESAKLNIQDYINNGVFDGPGDLALQHEFFTATQPSTGFRMTKVQQDILQNSRSWTQGAQARLRHALTGQWYSAEQRKQIAQAAMDAIAAKEKVLGGVTGASPLHGASPKTGAAPVSTPADPNDPLGLFTK